MFPRFQARASSTSWPMLFEAKPPSTSPVSNDPPPALLVADPPRPSAVKSVSEDCNLEWMRNQEQTIDFMNSLFIFYLSFTCSNYRNFSTLNGTKIGEPFPPERRSKVLNEVGANDR